MFAGRDDDIGVTDPDPGAIGDPLGRIRLVLAVSGDALDLEADPDRPPLPLIAGRKIAVDAVVDLDALGADADRLDHVE